MIDKDDNGAALNEQDFDAAFDDSKTRENKRQSFVGEPADEGQCSVDLTDEIAREIVLHLRLRLNRHGREDKEFFEILNIILKLLSNIVEHPLEEKYQKLKLNNKKIQSFIVSNSECMNLLDLIGFQQKDDVVTENDGL